MIPEDMIEVIQGYIDGKIIEGRSNYSEHYINVNIPPRLWDFRSVDYRIKTIEAIE